MSPTLTDTKPPTLPRQAAPPGRPASLEPRLLGSPPPLVDLTCPLCCISLPGAEDVSRCIWWHCLRRCPVGSGHGLTFVSCPGPRPRTASFQPPERVQKRSADGIRALVVRWARDGRPQTGTVTRPPPPAARTAGPPCVVCLLSCRGPPGTAGPCAPGPAWSPAEFIHLGEPGRVSPGQALPTAVSPPFLNLPCRDSSLPSSALLFLNDLQCIWNGRRWSNVSSLPLQFSLRSIFYEVFFQFYHDHISICMSFSMTAL